MQIGQVIRKYRKDKNMTQEEMANRLGVTAPAVNKWENGNSLPDIMLLSPIARLLNITLDTLLSFQEELTAEEINSFIYEMDSRFKNETYDEVFKWAKGIVATYPNCEQLIWQIAVVLDVRRLTDEVPNQERYDDYICNCYTSVLDSEDEDLRTRAADSLFGFYSRKGQYDKAEEYLSYYSLQNPERKRKQADIYCKTDRFEEAYKAYEELLFSYYGMISLTLNSIYVLAMQENDMERAQMLVEKQSKLAELFEMGGYHESSCRLELAVARKDVDATIEIMEKMLSSIDNIDDFRNSPLYKHMSFKEKREEFVAELKNKMIDSFRNEEVFGFLKDDKRVKELNE